MPQADQTTQLQLETLAQLGTLGAQVASIQGQVSMLVSANQRAEDSRQKLLDKLEMIDARATRSEYTLARITPLVDQHEMARQQFIGGGKTIGTVSRVLWYVGGAITFAFGWFLNHFWSGYLHGPPR